MEDNEPLLPSHREHHLNQCSLAFFWFGLIIVGMPFSAFLFCVYWSVRYNFREATATHCQVDNYLPSVSAAIGSFSPQKQIWMLAIVVHTPFRYILLRQYFKYFRSLFLSTKYLKLCDFCRHLQMTELVSLLGLTLVSSTDYYPVHAFAFSTFVLSSITQMCLSSFLYHSRRSGYRLKKLRLWLTFCNLVCFFCAAYYFVRHNSYCEAGGKLSES